MEVKFVSYMLKTDVIAVKFDGKYVLTGIGGFLNVYSLSGELLLKEAIFQGQKIHGICIQCAGKIAVFGGVKVALISLQYNGNKVSISKPILWHNNDWILHVQWIANDNIALVTAHNELSLWDTKTLTRLKTISCAEKCIIYSALLLGSTWSDLVVLAGTVFQEVIIWRVDGSSTDILEQPVLYRLQGHKGVIFSISYNPDSRCLSSTSDDRSVRVWSVSGGWHDATIELRHTLFGHKARVWRSVALSDVVISIGEDSQVCVWGGGGDLLRRWTTHQGGRVWGLDCSLEHNLIVTGGGDGGINLWPLRSWAEVSLTPVALPFPNSNLIPRRIRLVKEGVMITVTDSGCILSRSLEETEWNVLGQNDSFASYCILEVSPCKEFVALATLEGHVLIYRVKYECTKCSILKVIEINAMEGKVLSLQWVTSELIVTCGSGGVINVWRFDKTATQIEEAYKLMLPQSKESWVSAAVLYSTGDNDSLTTSGNFVCGDRGGSIHFYNLIKDETRVDPTTTCNRIHGRLGVCSVTLHGGQLFSTGRDGTVRQFEVLGGTLNHLSTDNVPMDWVTNTIDSCCGLLVLGFAEVNFVVWSWKERRSILEIECGGGHRSWDFSLDEKNNFHFVFVKDKMVHSIVCPLDQLVKPVLQEGFHTKESGCVCLLPADEQRVNPVIISGSEDTTIRLSTVDSTDQLTTVTILRSHISSVRALATFPLANTHSAILFSAGGRAHLQAWKVTTDGKSSVVAVKCQQLDSYMLKVQDRRPWRVAQALPTVDPETRYMDLCAFRFTTESSRVMVLAGCSDGLLRLFSYNLMGRKLYLEIEYPHYHNRCILKVSHLPLQSLIQVMLSLATDGLIAFWAIDENIIEEIKREEASGLNHLQPFGSLKIHQSGINSVDWIELESKTFLLATGGDDNALILTVLKIELNPAMGVETIAQRKIESLHSAQVTGLKFANNCLVSACIDQRVRVWTWNYTHANQTLDCSLVGEYCTTVADVQGLQLWQTRGRVSACIYGKGLEFIGIELTKTPDK